MSNMFIKANSKNDIALKNLAYSTSHFQSLL